MAAGGGTLSRERSSPSEDIFTSIEDHVARNPELVFVVGKVSSPSSSRAPDSTRTIDVKNGGTGSVDPASKLPPTLTLELTYEDFAAAAGDDERQGRRDGSYYMGGKLKISGDVMHIAEAGSFLQKIDPKHALEAIMKRGGGASGAAARARRARAQARAPSCRGSSSTDVFTAIEDHVARNPDLVSRVGKTFVFQLWSPYSRPGPST